MMSEELAACESISGVLESAVYYEPVAPMKVDIIARRTHSDSHEDGRPSAG